LQLDGVYSASWGAAEGVSTPIAKGFMNSSKGEASPKLLKYLEEEKKEVTYDEALANAKSN
jgi:hypothetical protein